MSLAAPKLIVSDVDGTLIDSRERVSRRLREALATFSAGGGYFALATGRPPRWLFPVLEQLPLRPICVCANGAVLYDSDSDRILTTRALSPSAMLELVGNAREALSAHGGVGVAVERAGVSAFDREPELFLVTPEYEHAWVSDEHGMGSEEEVLSQPAIKLLLRNDKLTAQEMYDLVRPAIPADLAHVTFSIGYGLLEVSAPGVTKQTGVADLAAILGIERAEIMAFGDMPNDIEMLSWAGRGYAMGNAREAVKAAADEVTTSNDEFGVARVIEALYR